MAKPFPNIPASAFGEGQVPRRIRRRFRRRADRYAEQIYGPEIEALQQRSDQIKRQYRRDKRAARGAVNFAQEAVSDVPLTGLTGRYRREVAGELAARSADIAASFPFMVAEARQTRNEALTDNRDAILDARISQQKEEAQTFQSLMGEARTDIETYLKERAQEAEAKKEEARTEADERHQNIKDRRKEVRIALRTATNLLAAMKDNRRPWSDAAIDRFGSEDASWGVFEEMLADEGDISREAAALAIEALRNRMQYAGRTPTEIGQSTANRKRRALAGAGYGSALPPVLR